MEHGGVGVLVLAGDVHEAGAVALRGGTARLVSAVVVVVLLQPVQRASPGRGLLLDVPQSLRVRMVPGPAILDVAEPLLHWRCCALLRRVACGVQACHSQMQHALLAQLEAETVAGDVVLAQSEGGEQLLSLDASEDLAGFLPRPCLSRRHVELCVEILDTCADVAVERPMRERAGAFSCVPATVYPGPGTGAVCVRAMPAGSYVQRAAAFTPGPGGARAAPRCSWTQHEHHVARGFVCSQCTEGFVCS